MKNNFRQKVYEIASKIPKGKVLTYGQLARLAGSPRAARAVGGCMSQNRDTARVPCHRVVAADGKLTGYSLRDGIKTKKELLLNEGVAFNGERVDLKTSQWLP